ncbi:MAG: DoxX family membrane protein [Acidobacteriota bacterium]|nr:DoxX family membrane protein [Acidobacteriota bacterium]
MKYAAMGARYLMGIIFVVFGLNGFIGFIELPPFEGPAGDFMSAMFGSGYLYVVKALEVIGGVLLLVGKKVPLALTLLTPVIVNILLFHIFLDMKGLPIAVVLVVLDAILLYEHRETLGKVIAAD